MRSHSGIIMTLGKGVAYSTSCKQNINTKSSTEVELVAIDDAMGQVLWTRHFLAAQGLSVPTTTIYQDNKSTILLAENGSTSSSKRTRHLDVRYYFVTDKVKNGEVKIAYCPTKDMLGDFFTKPLQGSAFIKMRENILNLPGTATDTVHRSVLRTDKFYSESTKGERNVTRGGNTNNVATNVKWAKGTKSGNTRDGVSK
jgi:hypothetical protein